MISLVRGREAEELCLCSSYLRLVLRQQLLLLGTLCTLPFNGQWMGMGGIGSAIEFK